MDTKELTRRFWSNVDAMKKKKGMTWEDFQIETGHSARSIATMKTMNKAPSFHFALAIAGALGTTIEELTIGDSMQASQEGSMNDVLYRICRDLDESDIFMLACTAKALREARSGEDPQALDNAIRRMKRRYL